MEIFRFKKEKFNLENFIHYYNDNIEELVKRKKAVEDLLLFST